MEEEQKTRSVGEKVKLAADFDSALTKALSDGQVEVVVSNSSLDRHGEKIVMEGIDLKQIKRNPVVLYGHDYDSLPIGKITKLWKDGGNLMARIQLAVNEYPFAKTVYDLITGGYLNAVSIGGVVQQWSADYLTIEKMEMVELSVVPVGANRDALVAAKSFGKDDDEIKREYQDFVRRAMVDKLAELPENEVNQAIDVLKSLVVALEGSAKAARSHGETETVETKKLKYITLRDSAKSVATQAERVIKVVKLQVKE